MKGFLTRINQRGGGIVEIIQQTARRTGEERVTEAAAGMAYYGFFSFFPLLLVTIVVIGTVLENTLSKEQILEALLQVFPFSHDLIAENISQVLGARGSVGIIGLLGLAWAALGGFTVLARNVNRAWPNAKTRNILKMRLMALIMLTVLIGGLLVLFVFNTVMDILPKPVNHIAEQATSSQFFSELSMVMLLFITLMVLYWWLPSTRVLWQDAAWGALASSISISIVTRGFTWYLESGLSTYNLIYGSLGTIVALLFWIYLLSLLVFIGAHLSASIAHYRKAKTVNDNENAE